MSIGSGVAGTETRRRPSKLPSTGVRLALSTLVASVLALTGAQLALGAQYPEEVTSDHPIGYWRLGDALDTTTMSDATGKYPGEYKNEAGGSPQLGIAGDGGTAAYFVGGGQYGEVKGIDTETLDAERHRIHDEFAMEAWVLPNHDNEAQMVMQQGGSGAIYINGEGHFAFLPDSNEIGVQLVDSETVEQRQGEPGPKAKNFVQVAGTWEKYNYGTARLYVNGKVVAEEKIAGTNDKAPWGSATFYIGYGDLAPWFSGYIDEVSYYDTALPEARIKAHYEADPPPPLWTPSRIVSSPKKSGDGSNKPNAGVTVGHKGHPRGHHSHKPKRHNKKHKRKHKRHK